MHYILHAYFYGSHYLNFHVIFQINIIMKLCAVILVNSKKYLQFYYTTLFGQMMRLYAFVGLVIV